MMNKRIPLALVLVALAGLYAQAANTVIQSATFSITMDEKARVISLANSKTQNEYLLEGSKQPLLSLRHFNSETRLEPISMTSRKEGDAQLLSLTYADGLKAEVKAQGSTHVTFTLLSVNQDDVVQAALWGPFETTLPEAVATSLGIVRGKDYSIGLLGLNLKTLAGYEAGGRCRFGNVVQEISDKGSLLQAFTLDRTREFISEDGILAIAIPGETIIGSSIALYGCSPEAELDLIGQIELAEGLPHPMVDGVWVKKLPRKYHSKILTGFNEENINECLAQAKAANIHVIRMKGLYESWGQYRVNKKYFPSGLEGLKRCVDKANAADVLLGSHLRLHLHDDDAYVSPEASEHLAIRGATTLATDIAVDATEITLADEDVLKYYQIPTTLRKGQKLSDLPRYVRVGTEIITYESISTDRPYRLLNCQRGTRKTAAKAHKAGESIGKLVTTTRQHQFFPDVVLAKEMAENLANLVNATGLPHLEMDGFDANDGHFQYTRKVFMETLFDRLENKNILHGASDLLPYHWHWVGLIGWGESRTTFRGSMLDYRIKVANFLRSNHIPIGLGQYKLVKVKSIEDIEWMCARAAGYDAGWDLYLSVEGLRGNPLRDQILQVMNNWQTAYIEGAFTDEQKELLKDVTREFKLNRKADGSWDLKQTGTWVIDAIGADQVHEATPEQDKEKQKKKKSRKRK